MSGRQVRLALLPLALAGVLLFVLTSCPSNRDGMPGRLASAMEETLVKALSSPAALLMPSPSGLGPTRDASPPH